MGIRRPNSRKMVVPMSNGPVSKDHRALVTVVIPTRLKNLDYLLAALRSLESQTFRDFEILIFVDGGGPNELSKLEAIADRRSTRIVWSQKNRGLARALNISFRVARTPFLARMDDDDLCLPNRLEVQMELMLTGKYDVLGSAARIMDESGEISGDIAEGFDFNNKIPLRTLFFGSVFLHPTVVMSREWAVRNRYNPNWGRGQDRELWVRSLATARATNVSEPLLVYRIPSKPKDLLVLNSLSTLKLLSQSGRRFGLRVYLLMPVAAVRFVYACVLAGYGRVSRYAKTSVGA